MMKYRIALAVCAAFFGATLSAFGSDVIEKLPRTQKSTSPNAQFPLKDMTPTEKLEASLVQISRIVRKDNEGKQPKDKCQSEPQLTIIKNKAKIYALQKCPTEAALNASLKHCYEESYDQMEHLQTELKSLSEFFHSAICHKMKENKKLLESTFASISVNVRTNG